MSIYAYGAIAGLQLAGSYFASQNIKESARLNRDIAEMNAQFAELDAYDAKLQGETEKAKYQKVVDQTLSEQTAALAAAGVDTSYGSVSEVAEESRFIAEMNRMEIEKQAEEMALGYKREAKGLRLNSFLNYNQSMLQAGGVMRQGVMSALQTMTPALGQIPTGYERQPAQQQDKDKKK